MEKIERIYFLLVIAVLVSLRIMVPAIAQQQKTQLSILAEAITAPEYGTVRLEGDIAVNDRIQLYSREYRSADQQITDRLLCDTVAAAEGSVALPYSLYAEPLAVEQYPQNFVYQNRDIVLKGLYAVVSDEFSSVISNMLFTDCSLDTGVVNQYWCSLAGSTACGTAAGVAAMQIAWPSAGDDLFTRLNLMRKYSLDGEDFSTGPAEYYLCGYHITNAVNRYIWEELSGDLIMMDHRTAEKTTEETLIELLSTGRPAVIEVCYLLGTVTRNFQGISHWITINGFTLGTAGYSFRFADSITVSYGSITSEMLETSNANVSYGDSGYIPDRYIGAFSEPLFSIEPVLR